MDRAYTQLQGPPLSWTPPACHVCAYRLRAWPAKWQLRVSQSRGSAAFLGDAPHSAPTPPRDPPSSPSSAGGQGSAWDRTLITIAHGP